MLFMHNNFTFNWFTYFVAVNYSLYIIQHKQQHKQQKKMCVKIANYARLK